MHSSQTKTTRGAVVAKVHVSICLRPPSFVNKQANWAVSEELYA